MNRITENLQNLFPWITTTDLIIISFALAIIVILLALYVYRDSKIRGGKSISWLIWTIILGGLIPFIFYLMVRSPLTKDEVREIDEKKEVTELQKKYYEIMIERESLKCPICGEDVKSDFLFCPHCFAQLKKQCSKCGNIVDKEFKICPYCGQVFDEKGEGL